MHNGALVYAELVLRMSELVIVPIGDLRIEVR